MAENNDEMMIGPGALAEQGESPLPLLYGATMYEWVEILNPLSRPFGGTFGMSRPMSAAPVNITPVRGQGITQNESDLRNNYGLDLRNPDHQARADIVNRVVIPSGKTVILLGNEAQVIIRQLVNAVMQLEGNALRMADPFARREVEERVVINRGSAAERLGQNPTTVQEQLQTVKEDKHEQEFPEITGGKVSELDGADRPSIGDFGQPGNGTLSPKAKAK